MKQKLTPWFSAAEHKPVRPGVYQVRGRWGNIGFSRFKRGKWYGVCQSVWYASEWNPLSSLMGGSEAQWRGIER